jgi:NADH:ubiquinone oxidoreductase subunit E
MDHEHGCGYTADVSKLPTRSPTHQEIEPDRHVRLGLDLEDIAVAETVPFGALRELAAEAGKPVSHYLAAIPLATELRLATDGSVVTARVCAGTCQRYGALDLLEHLAEHHAPRVAIEPVACLDRCDQGPACELHGAHGQLVLAPATTAALDEALRELT